MAEQRESIQRRVALKIIKEGMDTKQVIARFEAERQALSLMNHPHIATVLDAGKTDAGRPYFVMELVRGESITEYCDAHNLPTSERLNIFTDVCSAVQHAHQKGVIHRDIKPSNVMVANDGDRSVAKVIDFGVAKATQGRLTDKSLFTCFRQFIGTPAYMSPEQAGASLHDVDTRTDVYSLGVLLYELLTGTTPLDHAKLRNAALDEVGRRIREDEPPKPSARVSTMTQAERAKVAGSRMTEPERLGRLVRGELDWIVMKSIEKDRTRRYETVSALVADVLRYLDNQPVEAGPPSMSYRLRKFASRNWVAMSTTCVIALSLIVATMISTTGLVKAWRAQLSEQAAKEEAKLNLYVSDLHRVSAAYHQGNLALALPLLAEHKEQYGDRFEWRLFHRLCQQGDALHTFGGHSGSVDAMAVSSQGVIASGDSDGVLRLLDVETRTELARRKLSSGVKAIDFQSNGQLLAVAEVNNRVSLWKTAGLEETAVYPHQQTHIPISDITFLPNHDAILVTAGMHDLMRLWNLKTQHVTDVPKDDVRQGRRLAASPTRNLLSAFGPAANVRLIEPVDRDSLKIYAEIPWAHDHSMADVAFSQSDDRYFATTAGSEIKMWDMEKVREADMSNLEVTPVSILQENGLSHRVTKMSFSPNGHFLAAGDTTGSITLWRGRPDWRREESALLTLRGHSDKVNSLAYTHHFIVSASADRTVKLWAGDGKRKTGDVIVTEDSIFAVAFSADGKTLAAGGFDGRVRLFDTNSMKKRFDEKLHENQVMSVAISPNGRWLASSEGRWRRWGSYHKPGHRIALTNLDHLDDPGASYYFDDVSVAVGGIDFSPDSRSLLMGDNNSCLWLLDVEERVARKHPTEGGFIWGLRYAPDGKTFAVGGQHRPLELRSAESFERIAKVDSSISFAVAFDPAGQIVAFSRSGGPITLFDASDLTELKTLEGHADSPYSLAFIDGETLASCSLDGTVRLWNVDAGKEVATLSAHRGDVYGLAVARDGNTLASSGADNTIRLRRASSVDSGSIDGRR